MTLAPANQWGSMTNPMNNSKATKTALSLALYLALVSCCPPSSDDLDAESLIGMESSEVYANLGRPTSSGAADGIAFDSFNKDGILVYYTEEKGVVRKVTAGKFDGSPSYAGDVYGLPLRSSFAEWVNLCGKPASKSLVPNYNEAEWDMGEVRIVGQFWRHSGVDEAPGGWGEYEEDTAASITIYIPEQVTDFSLPQNLLGKPRSFVLKTLGPLPSTGDMEGVPFDHYSDSGISVLYDEQRLAYWVRLVAPSDAQLFGVPVSSDFDQCVAAWGKPLDVDRPSKERHYLAEWKVGAFSVTGEFWQPGQDESEADSINALSVSW